MSRPISSALLSIAKLQIKSEGKPRPELLRLNGRDEFRTIGNYPWPKTSDTPCESCRSKYTTMPIGFPVSEFQGKIMMKGKYCSFTCAMKNQTSPILSMIYDMNGQVDTLPPDHKTKYEWVDTGDQLFTKGSF